MSRNTTTCSIPFMSQLERYLQSLQKSKSPGHLLVLQLTVTGHQLNNCFQFKTVIPQSIRSLGFDHCLTIFLVIVRPQPKVNSLMPVSIMSDRDPQHSCSRELSPAQPRWNSNGSASSAFFIIRKLHFHATLQNCPQFPASSFHN